ncbi:LOW QUALITY PROTEIN: hypothetical protein U0070_018582 [Myodes glareolus]|uniref:Cathepsin propeptide inhibitor domain-containing protein n=1 Tax=Myodes glareolus TaxID=447135 RepID=A0AAW0ICI4_MYOGA
MASAAHSRDPSLDAEWEEWKKKFEKTYSPNEEGHRRALWEENKKIIEKHNAEYEQGKTSYTMGLNQFSDMVSEKRVTSSVLLHFGSLRLLFLNIFVCFSMETNEEFRTSCCGRPKFTQDLPKSETSFVLPKMMLRRKDHAEEEQEGSSPSHCPACALQEKTLTSFNSNIATQMILMYDESSRTEALMARMNDECV